MPEFPQETWQFMPVALVALPSFSLESKEIRGHPVLILRARTLLPIAVKWLSQSHNYYIQWHFNWNSLKKKNAFHSKRSAKAFRFAETSGDIFHVPTMQFLNYLSKNGRKTLQRQRIQFPKAWAIEGFLHSQRECICLRRNILIWPWYWPHLK